MVPTEVAAALVAWREPPVPIELMTHFFDDYERAKARAGRIDFEDMLLAPTVELLEHDTPPPSSGAQALVQRR